MGRADIRVPKVRNVVTAEVDKVVRASLTSFIESVRVTRWEGREREAVSLYAFEFLQKYFARGRLLLDPAQIGIELAVSGAGSTNRKRRHQSLPIGAVRPSPAAHREHHAATQIRRLTRTRTDDREYLEARIGTGRKDHERTAFDCYPAEHDATIEPHGIDEFRRDWPAVGRNDHEVARLQRVVSMNPSRITQLVTERADHFLPRREKLRVEFNEGVRKRLRRLTSWIKPLREQRNSHEVSFAHGLLEPHPTRRSTRKLSLIRPQEFRSSLELRPALELRARIHLRPQEGRHFQ